MAPLSDGTSTTDFASRVQKCKSQFSPTTWFWDQLDSATKLRIVWLCLHFVFMSRTCDLLLLCVCVRVRVCVCVRARARGHARKVHLSSSSFALWTQYWVIDSKKPDLVRMIIAITAQSSSLLQFQTHPHAHWHNTHTHTYTHTHTLKLQAHLHV